MFPLAAVKYSSLSPLKYFVSHNMREAYVNLMLSRTSINPLLYAQATITMHLTVDCIKKLIEKEEPNILQYHSPSKEPFVDGQQMVPQNQSIVVNEALRADCNTKLRDFPAVLHNLAFLRRLKKIIKHTAVYHSALEQ